MAIEKNKAKIFMPPNTLKLKVGSSSGKPRLDPAVLQKAENAMRDLSGEFPEWLAADIAALTKTFSTFAGATTAVHAGALFRAAHDLKGQATTFGYPLIARVASSLARLMDGLQSRDAAPLPLVTAHIDAIQVIHRDKIKDISNLVALTLTEELEGRVTLALERASQSA